MRKSLVGLLFVALATPAVVSAQAPAEHPWTVRARGIYIAPMAGASEVGPLSLEAGNNAVAEVDISRSFGKLLSAELILATTAHEVRIENGPSLGSAHMLPPTLLLQLRLPMQGSVHPYVGAGVNMTIFYDKTGVLESPDVVGLGNELTLGTSVGFTGQAGVDFDITPRTMFNVDAKYAMMKTTVTLDGTDLGDLDINPLIIGVGLGYRF